MRNWRKVFFFFFPILLHFLGELTETEKQNTYWVESVVLFEALFKNGWLIFRKSQLLSWSVTILFVADTTRASSLHFELISIRFPLASLAANARNRAVRRWDAHFFFVICMWWQSIHVDSSKKWSGLGATRLRVWICMSDQELDIVSGNYFLKLGSGRKKQVWGSSESE